MVAPRVYLPERAEDVGRWLRGELPSEVVKEGRARTVWRAGDRPPRLYVKRFPPELFRDRARAEARMLQALARAGIPCPRLVATARDRRGSYVMTEEVAGAAVLREALERGGPEARRLVEALGGLVRRLQEAGFEHQDLHVGNVLARDGALYVMDVHRAARRSRLTEARRIANAAFAAMSFLDLRPRSDVARFLRAAGFSGHGTWRRVWTRLRKELFRYYAGRTERCVEGGRGFGVRDGIYHRSDADVAAIEAWVRSGPMEPVKVEGTRGLYRSAQGLFLKRMRRGRAARYWRAAHGLAVRGLGTPRLLACGPTWVAGEWVDAPDLHAFVRERGAGLGRRERDALLVRLARDLHRMHARGVFHGDLKATNVLVRGGDFLFVDLDAVRFREELTERERILNLAQLNASLAPPLTRTDRVRFLRAYGGPCASIRRDERRWTREVMRITAARRHRWPPPGGSS